MHTRTHVYTHTYSVAREYGFTKACHVADYSDAHPLMNPFKQENVYHDSSTETWNEGFKAVVSIVCVVG